jgi:hypothetical protein
MPAPLVSLSGVNLATLGVHINGVRGSLAPGEASYPRRPAPGGDGPVLMGVDAVRGERKLVLEGFLSAATLEDLQARRDALIWYLEDRPLDLRLADTLNRFLAGRVEAYAINPVGPWARLERPQVELSIHFVADDGRWLAEAETVIALSATPAACPLGNARSFPKITIPGPAVEPEVTYRAADGTVRRVVAFLPGTEIADGAKLIIDSTDTTVVDQDGDNRIALLAECGFIVLDRGDAAGPAGPWPTLEGPPGASARYRRAWW